MINANDTTVINTAIEASLARFAASEEEKRRAAALDVERRVAAINAVGQYLADQRRKNKKS